MTAEYVRKFGRDRRPSFDVQRFYIPIHEHNQPCQNCKRHSRTLFMGVCSKCEDKTYYTPAGGPGDYLCWVPNYAPQDNQFAPRADNVADNPAYAEQKWWVKVS